MEAPAELGVTAVLVGAAGVVAYIQLVAALGHGGDAHVHLEHKDMLSSHEPEEMNLQRPETFVSGDFQLSTGINCRMTSKNRLLFSKFQ